MLSLLEATMARGRAAGVTQRIARSIGRDGRTVTLEPDGRTVLAFATCSYLGLDRDPRLALGAIAAIEKHGVAFSASRCFVTNPLYAQAESLLADVFGRPVVLAGSTTLAHGAALPMLVDRKDVVLFDHQVHHSVQTALAALGPRGPRCEAAPHNDLDALESAIVAELARGTRRIWYCADGIYSMFGDRLDVRGLATLMDRYPALHAYLDDAHGMSWCGKRGTGSLLHAALPADRTIIATSLGKGFGCSGGLLVLPDVATKHRIENLGPSLMFSIQLPPPVLGAVCESALIHRSDEIVTMQRTLAERTALARSLLGPRLARGGDTPILYVTIGKVEAVIDTAAAMLEQGFLVNPVAYPAVPRNAGGLRITITRSHTEADIHALAGALAAVLPAEAESRVA